MPGPISSHDERASGRRSRDLGVIRIRGLRKGSAIWRLWMWKQLAESFGHTKKAQIQSGLVIIYEIQDPKESSDHALIAK